VTEERKERLKKWKVQQKTNMRVRRKGVEKEQIQI